jgi:thiamine-phosphate pyrophosphorylase
MNKESLLLYAVTDNAWLQGRTLAQCVAEALEGGATFVQLRDKGASFEELCEEARELQELCRQAGVPFVVNDEVEVAHAIGADGVHVGQDDMACEKARALLGPHAIVGVSVQTVEQARVAQAAGASYVGVGAVVPTPTKPEAPVVSAETFKAIARSIDIPIVAIGGINAHTMSEIKGLPISGVAVVSAIFAAPDIAQATAELKRLVEENLSAS